MYDNDLKTDKNLIPGEVLHELLRNFCAFIYFVLFSKVHPVKISCKDIPDFKFQLRQTMFSYSMYELIWKARESCLCVTRYLGTKASEQKTNMFVG